MIAPSDSSDNVKMIIDAPSLKDGSGRELRRLHDTVLQHFKNTQDHGL